MPPGPRRFSAYIISGSRGVLSHCVDNSAEFSELLLICGFKLKLGGMQPDWLAAHSESVFRQGDRLPAVQSLIQSF